MMDPNLWRAFSGNSAHIHTVGSEVYYFVQGHLEHATYVPTLSRSVLSNPTTKCIVSAADYTADSLTDEVCLKLNLKPIPPGQSVSQAVHPFGCSGDGNGKRNRIEKFAKVLTSSDANNGGGFSVPRYCADSIFPPLNYQVEPPVQTLSITDVHGVVWNFRHIYRGTPRRHLLTTGWSKFVNHKKLIAGDAVIFARNSSGDMFVGIRRFGNSKSNGGGDCSKWNSEVGGGGRCNVEEKRSGDKGTVGFSRINIGKVLAETVANAAEMAVEFRPFEVVYYPRTGTSEFVVPAEKVNNSLNYQWYPGIRVKMPVETEDSLKTQWFQGTVTSASVPAHGPWKGSPWRMLEVTWEETDALQSAKFVSPWEVELASPSPPIPPPLHSAKKYRGPQKSGMVNGEADLFSPMMRFDDSTMGQFNQSLLNFNSFPAGMQGARQNFFCESGSFNPYNEISPPTCDENSMFKLNVAPKTQTVSTDLQIGSVQSGTLSPDSQASVLSFATGTAENQSCNSTKAGVNSFQLFGQIIYTSPPVENGLDNDANKNANNDGGEKKRKQCN